jgi:fatty-acid desaturase
MKPVRALIHWIDTADASTVDGAAADRIDWLRVLPFLGLHLACLGVFFVGVSAAALWTAAALYALRMFAITGFYHRYFSHRAFRTSRRACNAARCGGPRTIATTTATPTPSATCTRRGTASGAATSAGS